jgi:hypothetical protein
MDLSRNNKGASRPLTEEEVIFIKKAIVIIVLVVTGIFTAISTYMHIWKPDKTMEYYVDAGLITMSRGGNKHKCEVERMLCEQNDFCSTTCMWFEGTGKN